MKAVVLSGGTRGCIAEWGEKGKTPLDTRDSES